MKHYVLLILEQSLTSEQLQQLASDLEKTLDLSEGTITPLSEEKTQKLLKEAETDGCQSQ